MVGCQLGSGRSFGGAAAGGGVHAVGDDGSLSQAVFHSCVSGSVPDTVGAERNPLVAAVVLFCGWRRRVRACPSELGRGGEEVPFGGGVIGGPLAGGAGGAGDQFEVAAPKRAGVGLAEQEFGGGDDLWTRRGVCRFGGGTLFFAVTACSLGLRRSGVPGLRV